MKKSKIFLATGAFILAASAIFATKVNKRFSNLSTVKISGGQKLVWGSDIFTTKQPTGFVPVYMAIYTQTNSTINGGVANQLETVSGAKQVFVHAGGL